MGREEQAQSGKDEKLFHGRNPLSAHATLRVLAPGNVLEDTNVTFARTCDPQVAVAGGAWRSQAARFAASSSCVMIGDLADEPVLMSAPCSHFEQTRTRGSDAAVTPT